MAEISVDIDLENTPEPQSFGEPIPDGRYMAHIVANEDKYTNEGQGKIAALTWEVLEGEYEHRRIWDNIVYLKTDGTTNVHGNRRIANICRSIGYTDGKIDMDLWMGIPVYITVKIKAGGPKIGGGTWPPKNEVDRTDPLSAEPPAPEAPRPAPAARPTASAARPAPAATGARPKPTWMSKPAGGRPQPAAVDDEIPF